MLTRGEDVEAHSLRKRGWSVPAIARHLGRDRKTVRACLNGQREPGRRRPAEPDRFGRFAEYCRIRFAGDPHLFAAALFEEVTALGYGGSYPSFTRALRTRGLRPRCGRCAAAATPGGFAMIGHLPGEETQWGWVELPGPPAWWGWGKTAHLLVAALAASGKWRGVLAECEEQPYLTASLHAVCERLGGLTRRWRFDRMSTVCHPESGDLLASFAEAAERYGVAVDVCPSRRGWRKGVVEKASHSAAQRWWRTLPDDASPAQAQARLDAWCARHGDARRRVRDGAQTTAGQLAAAEPPAGLPLAPFPAVIAGTRVVPAQARVAWHGNFCSVPPGHAGQRVTVRHRLGTVTLDIVTMAGTVLARHHREPDHAAAVTRDAGHVAALEDKVLAARGDNRGPRRRKERRPPSAAALAGAAGIRGEPAAGATVTDFAAWAAAARPRRPGSTAQQ